VQFIGVAAKTGSHMKWFIRICAVGVAIWLAIGMRSLPVVRAFCTLDARWSGETVPISYNFAPSGALVNGTDSWGDNVESAMSEWSGVSELIRFDSRGQGAAGQDNRDGINNMLFDDNIAGEPFDDEVLALTLTRISGSRSVIETDVIFTVSVEWNAYDGPLRTNSEGKPVFDFRRVALHELGHVLGLDHPDDSCGQLVEAVMNAKTSNLDRLTDDDRDGLGSLYGGTRNGPIADAGSDQRGDGIRPFVLDGSGSQDLDGLIASYEWWLDGRLIARGRFAEVMLDEGVHRITLTVTDNDGLTDSDTLVITVGDVAGPGSENLAPVADSGEDQTVDEGERVVLDGSGSRDADGEIVRYVWSENGNIIARGRVVEVALSAGIHVLTLGVFDDAGGGGTDDVIVTVNALASNPVPTAEPLNPSNDAPVVAGTCGALGWIFLPMLYVALWCLRLSSDPHRKRGGNGSVRD
jgi:hypothetical protein